MAKPVLIVVQGIPGTGKTTLSRKLAKDLPMPRIGKDDIKELLFDHMGIGDGAWSRDIGRATADMLFVLMDDLAGAGRSFMVESAFYVEFAIPRITEIVQRHGITMLELYCTTDREVRSKRFIERYQSGDRHPGHVDTVQTDRTPDELDSIYAPLNIGTCITVDTTVFGEAEYQALLARIQSVLAEYRSKN